ncbi:MAG: hypothetical protein ACQXXH_01475 [Candidatus Bathyarchaeia archaeon]|nr:hypothetical protein [Candidatus Bathyarchaeota archaeon A05DMB-4]MDH7596095.1 hypothetical protein [Candidatus Bathyarchaeota archaeon]
MKQPHLLLCGDKPIKNSSPMKFAFALIGGVLAILSSLGCGLLGLFFIMGFRANLLDYPNSPPDYLVLSIGILGILGFVLGLAGGVMTLLRRKFVLAIVGPSLIIIEALVTTLRFATNPFGISLLVIYTITLLALALLSVIFVTIAKQEFR